MIERREKGRRSDDVGTRTNGARRRPRPEPRLAKRVQVFDLWTEANSLIVEESWAKHGHNAKTLEKRDDSCLILEVLRSGKTIARHSAPSSVQLHVLSGRIRVRVGERSIDLIAGHCLVLAPRIPHDVSAIVDTAFTLTCR